ncbi:hypothetical protein O181_008771 [Austropuccinia psidii MF-1]|uniref:Uncharacterized protein n=1 Tax=Austropuccinia psidii MF-1 TaxID=1389203 RepID=A0A9Q3BQH2_9BASI|nr:hypothetical protein [Austropuccinia psidii MF-1]
MFQHFSTQTHSSPEGDRLVVFFSPFQYKQNMKKLKSGIEPNAIPNIPNFTSGSECLHILLDQIFPNDCSELTQSMFSTSPGLNSMELKPYSRSQKLTPQDLGMIISTILSLSYNIHCRASRILTPTLNLLIKSSISISGSHSTPAFHIRQDLSTIFGHLQLEPLTESYICCP